jgi:fatty acid-binding protein DegV
MEKTAMTYKIVADSSANLFNLPLVSNLPTVSNLPDVEGERGDIAFAHVPLKVVTASAEYSDDPGLNIKKMTEEILQAKGKSGTSCPSIADWSDKFDGADRIFVVTMTSNLSATYSTAVRAALDYMEEHEGVRIHVIDSLSTGPEMRLIIEKLITLIHSGMDFDDIIKNVRKYQVHTHLLFSLVVN